MKLATEGILRIGSEIWLPNKDYVDSMIKKYSRNICHHYEIKYIPRSELSRNLLVTATTDATKELELVEYGPTNETELSKLHNEYPFICLTVVSLDKTSHVVIPQSKKRKL